MNLRIQTHELPVTVVKAVGLMANHGRLRVAEVQYDPKEKTVCFPLERFPITGKSIFIRHAKTPVRCCVTFRNVTECKIEDRTDGMEIVDLIFGFTLRQDEIYLCSSAEDRGTPCYQMTCRVSSLDIEITDE